MKRFMALFLAVIFALSAFAACGNDIAGPSPSSQEPQKPGESNVPAQPDSITITTIDNWYTAKSYKDGLPVLKVLEEKTNTKITWDVAPGSEYGDYLNLKLQSGQGLGDIVYAFGIDFVTYGHLFTPLNDLIDQHGPNIKKAFEDYPDIEVFNTRSDGQIMSLCTRLKADNYPFGVLFIRKDWLDKLSIPMPVTTDDFYNAMKAFQDNDMNGNGIKDEYWTMYGIYHKWLTIPFGCRPDVDYVTMIHPDKNGKMNSDLLTEAGKNGLTYLNKLYNANILDPSFINMPMDVYNQRFANNQVGATMWYAWGKSYCDSKIVSVDPDVNFQPVVLRGTGSTAVDKLYAAPQASANQALTVASNNKEAAMRIMDFMYSKEGQDLISYGIEGDTYNVVDGKVQFTDKALKNSEGLDLMTYMQSIGAQPNLARIEDDETLFAAMLTGETLENALKTAESVEPFELWRAYTMSPEEQEKAKNTELPTYVEEMLIAFITGDRPLSEFDKFGQELMDFGFGKVIEAYQDLYDRVTK